MSDLIELDVNTFYDNVAQDPCSNYEWLKDSLYRGTNCPAIDNKELCDKYDIDYDQWYRVKGDKEMVTEKVEIFKCGTEFPIWLNGTLPKTGELVNTTACINEGLSVSRGACDKEMDIQILECTGYYWHKRFEDERDNLEDDEREGRPSSRKSDAVKDEVSNVINSDRRLTVCEVADKCDNSKTTAHHILANGLNMNRVLRRDLVQALRKKRPYLAANIDQVILHQDNAPAHTSLKTSLEIDLLGFECLKHPPYILDLAPMDFAVFPHIKSFLHGQRFDDLPELRQEVMNIILKIKTEQFEKIFDDWVKRCKKCVALKGDYVEKS
ncbi:unnamed protein product [Mytilus edulis]|uniref:Uncharacterized protein n=1 Tax=Mytilus edulis TaxID=6550 RepID=A0A8S3SFN9_MYTED|nr:unnamed protein product [Mytilus edulis]